MPDLPKTRDFQIWLSHQLLILRIKSGFCITPLRYPKGTKKFEINIPLTTSLLTYTPLCPPSYPPPTPRVWKIPLRSFCGQIIVPRQYVLLKLRYFLSSLMLSTFGPSPVSPVRLLATSSQH